LSTFSIRNDYPPLTYENVSHRQTLSAIESKKSTIIYLTSFIPHAILFLLLIENRLTSGLGESK
jgi:hypothetical protein